MNPAARQAAREPLPLQPVPLQELRLLPGGFSWQVETSLEGFEALTPVRGRIRALVTAELLEVEGEGSTIVTLCCDRCLQHFNHALEFRARELVWVGEGPPDTVAAGEEIWDQLDPRGAFDPARWLFEQLSLNLPLRNQCGEGCPGPAQWTADPQMDPRWTALRSLSDEER